MTTMQSNIQFLVQKYPAKGDAFWDMLASMSQKRSFYTPNFADASTRPALRELQQHEIRNCVVGPNHVAFLLKDGRICRVQYTVCDSCATKNSNSTNDSAKDSRKSGERPPKMPRSATSPWIVSAADLSSSGSSSLRKWGSHIGVIRSMASHSSSSSIGSSSSQRVRRGGIPDAGSALNSASAVRLLRGRGLQSSLITGHRVMVPASHVPDELINQVQGILQGKSRSVIVRELQRTSLDVNLAVNNLLSRDDEDNDNDDGDDNGNDYAPGEDLLSLLDSGVNPGDHGVFIDADILPEELLGYTLSRAPRSASSARGGLSNREGSGKDSSQNRDPIIRLRSPRFVETRRYESGQDESPHQEKPAVKDRDSKGGSKFPSVNLADELEWWMEGGDFVRFVCIGAMYSELNAVDLFGNLRQWRWKKHFPYQHPSQPNIYHPRASHLGLEAKKVTYLAACFLRASVLTEEGGVATWIDESASSHASMLEHAVTPCVDPDLAMPFDDQKLMDMQNKCVHVSSLYSALLTNSGEVYVWGALPFHLRKKVLERAQSSFKKTMKSGASDEEIKVGSMVRLKNCPVYQAGAIAINIVQGQPKVGRLQQPVWSLTETCPFKIVRRKLKRKNRSGDKDLESHSKNNEANVQRQSASNTNRNRETVVKSTASSNSIRNSAGTRKRKYDLDSPTNKESKEGAGNTESSSEEALEFWRMRDVLFVEDSQSPAAGKVIKIDGDVVAVVFSKPGKSLGDKISRKSLLKNMRLLKKGDVSILSQEVASKTPECFLKRPRKLQISPSVRLHCMCATEVGLEAIEGGVDGSPMRFVTIDLSGKVEGDVLPTPSKFFGPDEGNLESTTTLKSKLSLNRCHQGFPSLLRDANSCLYPLLRNENSGIRDPCWLNLSPVTAFSLGIHANAKPSSSRSKNGNTTSDWLSVSVMVMKSQLLTPMIIHRNHKAVQKFLDELTEDNVQGVCKERCDGKRNILHVAVSVTCPTSSASEKETADSKIVTRSEQRGSASPPQQADQTPTSNASQSMSQNDRVNAVHAIANAISVVAGNDGNQPRLRDIMQQFAAVWDDSSGPNLRNPSTTVASSTPTWQPASHSRSEWRVGSDESMEIPMSVSSPAPIPTQSWPPEPSPHLSPAQSASSGLNLSTRVSCTTTSTTNNGKQPLPGSKLKISQGSTTTDSNLKYRKERGSVYDGLAILRTLCTSAALKPVLFKLLSERDAHGHTPFMSAVYQRAYPAAIELFKEILCIAENRCSNQSEETNPGSSSNTIKTQNNKYYETLMAMVYPPKSDPDANPLYLVCVNDTCSFTWTGAQHINQDIYECWTCGLTGSLCCCSECARVCHNGHDCKLKKTSPTAYCDCWEKCACRSLIAGDTDRRMDLLRKLLEKTKLVNLINSRGETILHFLANTVARQSVEQRQHRSRGTVSSRSSQSGKLAFPAGEYGTPQHDLQPPTFCREAFLHLLQDWSSVRSTVLTSYHEQPAYDYLSSDADMSSVLLPEEEMCLSSQTGTSPLDLFVICMVVKCNTMYLDMLLETLINQMQNFNAAESREQDIEVVHGFIRSLVRVFVILSICSGPDSVTAKFVGRSVSTAQPLKRIQRAFNALAPVAIKELCEMASALIDPVRLGIAVPTALFGFLSSSTDIISSCELAFAQPPFHRKHSTNKKKRKPESSRRGGTSSRTTSSYLLSRRNSSSTRKGVIQLQNTATSSTSETNTRDADTSSSTRVELSHDLVRVTAVATNRDENAESEENTLADHGEFISTNWENPSNQEDTDHNDSYVEAAENDPPQGDVPDDIAAEGRDRANSTDSQHDVISEGDLDMDDEDEVHDDGDENYMNNDDESDMDLTLLAGSDADTDVGSDFSGDENDEKEKEGEGEDEDSQSQRPWLLVGEMSDEMAGGDDDNNQEDDTEDGDGEEGEGEGDGDDKRTYTITSDDEEEPAVLMEDDGSASSQAEEGPDANNQDEDEDDEMASQQEFPLERASTRIQRQRAAAAPQSMRWALGSGRAAFAPSGISNAPGRSSSQSASSAVNLVYVDPLSLRRGNPSGMGASLPPVGSPNEAAKQVTNSTSISTTQAQLARAFRVCICEAAKLIYAVWQGEHAMNAPLSTFLELKESDIRELKDYADRTLSETWKWLLTVIDSTEAQLRYGQVLSLSGSPGSSPDHARKRPSRSFLERPGGVAMFSKPSYSRSVREQDTDFGPARQDFLRYALSLMRAHTSEHGGFLPVMNVSSMRHVAYVLDALVFYMRETLPVFDGDHKRQKGDSSKSAVKKPSLNLGYCSTDDEDNEEMRSSNKQESSISDLPDELYSIAVSDVLVGGIIANAQRKVDPGGSYSHPQRTFFRRSESMTFLGCTDPDPFTEPMVKTLPLADKPHLLQPNARKEELFGRMRNQIGGIEDDSYFDTGLAGTGMGRLKHKLHLKFDKIRQKKAEEKAGKAQKQGQFPDKTSPKQNQRSTSVITQSNAMDTTESPATNLTTEAMNTKDDKPIHAPLKESMKNKVCKFLPSSVNLLLARCRITMELFTKVFLDDVGAEPGSILQELGGFEVREAKFRKEMEKLRNSQTVDLQLTVERDPNRLILGTFKQLNQHFRRRTSSSSMGVTSQPLAVQRVKVIFKDEPGEGSGVSRSFYTALCEALLSSNKLPPLDDILVPSDSLSSSRNSAAKKRDHDRERLGRPAGKKVNLRSYFMARYALQSSASGKSSSSTLSPVPPLYRRAGQGNDRGEFGGWSRYKRAIGDRLFPKVNAINSKWPKKITGILLAQPISDLLMLLNNDSTLKASVQEASRFLSSIHYNAEEEQEVPTSSESSAPDPTENSPTANSLSRPPLLTSLSRVINQPEEKKSQNSDSGGNEEDEDDDVEEDISTYPLFYQPGKRGFYSPAAGPCPKRLSEDTQDALTKLSTGYEARLSAFRNVGRIIGLCLLQNELCPLPLNRHVLKALLGRKINWYDFAFFDPTLYESMRFLLAECENYGEENDLLDGLELSFVADLLPEEGGGEVELIPNGSSTPVKPDNVKDYVQKYAVYRMITCCHRFIEKVREGLFDVLPQSSFSGLTAEDLRLLLNGCGRVSVRTLISYTSFNDESGKAAGSNTDKLTEFKRWFWAVVEGMSHPARQELLYFWTGSPALPASEDGFQPLPTITIRPPDDQHLPTANTCISRLYVPLYSSRGILKKKLMLAIKTKNFGFV